MTNRDAIAVIEFSLEFDHFFNIDLYVGGFYQLRCQLKTAKKLPSKIDVSIPRSNAPQLFPASVVNGKAVGTAFEILYKEEDIQLNDTIEYKAFVPLKMSKLPNSIQFFLILELWYIDKDEMLRKGSTDVFTSFECVSKRHLILNFPLFRGLHYHRPVMFDYFHLCAASVTVHGSLVALEKTNPAASVAFAKQQLQPSSASDKHRSNSTALAPGSGSTTPNAAAVPEVTPPFVSSASSTPRLSSATSLASSPDLSRRFASGASSANMTTTFEEAVFGTTTKTSWTMVQRLQNAYQFHRSVCRLLLTAYEALELKLTQLLHCLPSRYQIRIQSVDCAKKFEILQQNIQRLEDESELLTAIDGNVALLSGELTMLWRQFLELFRGREEIRHQLAKDHHTARVRRLAEGFFSGSECASTSTLIDFTNVGKMEKICERLEDQLRKSAYFQCLPPLGVYCEDLDGGPDILPVVFEQRYQSVAALSAPIEQIQQQATASAFNSSSPAKPPTPAGVMENAETKKEILKNALSLDLPHVHRPAKQQQKIEPSGIKITTDPDLAESKAESKYQDDLPDREPLRMETTSRKPLLLSRSTSFRVWRQQSQLRSSFRMDNCEMDRFDGGGGITGSTDLSEFVDHHRAPVHFSRVPRSVSMPDLKIPETPDGVRPLDTDQLAIDISEDRRQQPETSVRNGVSSSSRVKEKATKTSVAFGCLNCCQTMDISAAAEPECTEETISNAGRAELDNGYQPTTKVSAPVAGRRTSTLSGDEENEHQVGVPFGQDALANAEHNLIVSPGQMPASADSMPRLTSGIEQELLQFVAAKEQYKQRMRDILYDGHLCSDFSGFPSTIPYFLRWNSSDCANGSDVHLVVCVHGLDGTCADLRMVRAYIELCLPDRRIDFLMSKRNQMDTFNDFDTMTRNLVDELLLYLSHCSTHPARISFIGHSLGNVIIRSALADPRLEPWLERLYTFLSLNGPHCGILYNNNSVVNMGIWFVQRWKKSISLQQMALRDNADLRQTFMYQLSMKPCFQYFKYVLLVGSHDDFYVPMHSALVQVCRPSMKDTTQLGQVYTEIVHNIMLPLLSGNRTTVIRYSVFHAQQASSTTSHLLGRAAHIAVLDSDLFIEKLLTVSALRYFR